MQVNAQNRDAQWNRTATTNTRQVEDWLEKKGRGWRDVWVWNRVWVYLRLEIAC